AGWVGGFEDAIARIWLARGHGEADAAEVAAGQAADFLPGFAAVGAAVQGGAGAAVDERPDVPAALVTGGEQDVRLVGVLDDVGDAGVLVDVVIIVPGLAAVDGLVAAAVADGAQV